MEPSHDPIGPRFVGRRRRTRRGEIWPRFVGVGYVNAYGHVSDFMIDVNVSIRSGRVKKVTGFNLYLPVCVMWYYRI